MKTRIEIKNRWTGKIIFEFETEGNTIAKTINEYVRKTKADNGVFARADLTDADLTDADLTRANLARADMTRADMTRANLTDADLTRADLTDADMTRANLTRFKNDIWRVLLMYKHEIGGLKEALKNGKINGSAYSGECACLKGTIANVKGCPIDEIPNLVQNVHEPCEQWFLQISIGQTPETSNVVKMTVEWIEEFEMYLNAK